MIQKIRRKAQSLIKDYRRESVLGKKLQPVTTDKIYSFQKKYDLRINTIYKEFLLEYNGTIGGQGGFMGIDTGDTFCNSDDFYEVYPDWILRKWLPVATDGCGNAYIMHCSDSDLNGFIFFKDLMSTSETEISYYVGSNIWSFAYMMLYMEKRNEAEIFDGLWPFDQEFVTSNDPDILKAPYNLLPWNVV